MFKLVKLFILIVIVKIMNIKSEMDGYIVKGEYANIKDFPHSAFLNVKCPYIWTCGASILNQRILLTAGHCVYQCDVINSKKHFIEVYVGHQDLSKMTIMRLASDYIMHEDYDDYLIENDVAVVMVKNKIPFSMNVKRIILPKYSFPGPNGFVAGWGIVNEMPLKTTLRLFSVNQKVRSRKTCDLIHLSPGMLCAGSTIAEDPHPASGDSGSAFVYKDVYQIGLVSFKTKSYPALNVYTNVTYYLKWIKKSSQQLYCKYMQNKVIE